MPTVSISLIREHTEKIRPPRSLWVPFELGRPFGAPNNPEFQIDVLRATLALLGSGPGPVLEDYPHDAPAGAAEDGPWACPVALPAPDLATTEVGRLREGLLGEIARLRPWHEEAMKARGRSTIAVSGLGVEGVDQMAETLAAFAAGETVEPPDGASDEMPVLIRYLSDDLKAFYLEAATAQPGHRGTVDDLNAWLFGQTALGDILYRVRDRLAASDDPREKAIGGGVIPSTYARRPSS